MICILQIFFRFDLAVHLHCFLSSSVPLCCIFKGIKKGKRLEKNACFWNSYLKAGNIKQLNFCNSIKINSSLFLEQIWWIMK